MTAPSDSGAAQPSAPAQTAQPAEPTFEVALAELAELVARLESGGLGLSESIGAYERGVTLLRGLHDQLAAVEERVRTLVRIDEHGRPVLSPPDSGQPAGEKPAAEKPGRTPRSGRAKRLPGMDDGEGPP